MDYRKVLMLHYTNGMSSREISQTTGDGKTTVNEFLKRFRECEGLSYPLSSEVTNESLHELLYQKTGVSSDPDLYRDFDPEEVQRLMTRKGETLKYLWKKYNAGGHHGWQETSELPPVLQTVFRLAEKREGRCVETFLS